MLTLKYIYWSISRRNRCWISVIFILFSYNTWPLMNGQVVPSTALEKDPKWLNFFENRALVQFNHRNMAYITSSVSFYLMYTIVKNQMHTPASFAGVLAFFLINYQAVSGILTLLHMVPP